MRPSRVGIALVLISAGLLRLWAIRSGIPDGVQPGEAEFVERATGMMKSGDFNPHLFDQPALYLYLQVLIASVRFLAGAVNGTWQSLDQVSAADFYVVGRLATAILGTTTAFIVYLIGLRWGARHALLGAGLLAVMSTHVRASHFVGIDVPTTFFTTTTLLLSLRAHEKPTPLAFMWAGVAAGLAAATGYAGAIAVLLPLVAAWMTLEAQPSRGRCAAAAVAAGLVAFLVGAPFTVLDLPGFLNGVAAAANRITTGPGGAAAMAGVFDYARAALGWPALLLGLAGVGLGLVRAVKGPGRVRWTLLVAFPAVYAYLMAARAAAAPDLLLPILPFLCVLAAIAVVSGVSLLRRFEIPRAPRTALIAGLTVAALLPPAVDAIRFDRMMSRAAEAPPHTVGLAPARPPSQTVPSGP
jgi:4-amino-4-deoxy-L-arabinose transferase-like glycosyltransferase